MPARDLYHDAIKDALIQDGWLITHDPYVIKYEDAELYADLGAEKTLAAERQGDRIAVEVKSFTGRSMMYDFHGALGQYIVYRDLIRLTDPDRTLYLGIDEFVYAEFFQRRAVATVIRQNQLRLVVVNISQREIVLWIP